ncbi:MAG TPA: DUF542 domain-containing protein [Thermoanaerobaculia bacterium]|nr:DUF542 domain-containing protein [Thermoanaerobaculia bacterium]
MVIQTTFSADLTLSETLRRLPAAIDVFEAAEIDYSCQGARSLADAAQESGYEVEEILARLEAARRNGGGRNWFDEPILELLESLVNDHRATIADRIPEIQKDIEHAVTAIGPIEEIQRIRILFSYLASTLSTHVLNEERDLFPFITELEAAISESMGPPRMRISQRVLRELVEHETFHERFRTLRELLDRLPANDTVDTLRRNLIQFSNEVHRHMHLENNVLYPRVIEIENGLRRSTMASA